MKCKFKMFLTACLLLLTLFVFSGCLGETTRYEANDKENYTVSVKYDANGGYLVVRKDGEVVCYHFYNRNDIEDYLYYNTRFERASRSRYGFGSLYRGDDGQVYIKLNLQIRFLK